MSRTYNSKQRGMRKLRNKMIKSYLRLSFCDDIWHLRKKDRTKSRLLRSREKQQLIKEIRNDYYE